jgi:hypothetical protein
MQEVYTHTLLKSWSRECDAVVGVRRIWCRFSILLFRRNELLHAAITGGHVLTALPDARRTSCLSSLLAENAHPVKR